ncbi:hypothetical protein GO988_08855 [Hymenobacter sp. HMF4947]|uniref:Uncharacterized protein n=1 Tax=Hymenobacter ginkgonis TaxID=2682976 RepID=A0A7K1TDM0_9BACT|nr:hypothetical protein [Hymenobacter ginkgonis]MVN76432.1 hypothetical protein [Hymenobacter ginkgonis]
MNPNTESYLKSLAEARKVQVEKEVAQPEIEARAQKEYAAIPSLISEAVLDFNKNATVQELGLTLRLDGPVNNVDGIHYLLRLLGGNTKQRGNLLLISLLGFHGLRSVALKLANWESNLTTEAVRHGIRAVGYVPGEEPRPIGGESKYQAVPVDLTYLWVMENGKESDGVPFKNLLSTRIDKLVRANI